MMTVASIDSDIGEQHELGGPNSGKVRPERRLSDSFWMYTYKIQMCPKKEFHDWEKCAYAHSGERARRRHPSKYQAVQCPEARAKKVCPRGADCPCTHHLFEYWLHPDRYLTCLCELGPACNRPICFFAHSEDELRPLLPDPSVATQSANKSEHPENTSAAAVCTQSTVADLVGTFGQGLTLKAKCSDDSSTAPAACKPARPATTDPLPADEAVSPSGGGSGVQYLIQQLATADSSLGSKAFAALDDLAPGMGSQQQTAVSSPVGSAIGAAGKSQSAPLAVVLVAPNPSLVPKSSSEGIILSPVAGMGSITFSNINQQQMLQGRRPSWRQTPATIVNSARISPTRVALHSAMLANRRLSNEYVPAASAINVNMLSHQASAASTVWSESPVGSGMLKTSSSTVASPRSTTSGFEVADFQQRPLGYAGVLDSYLRASTGSLGSCIAPGTANECGVFSGAGMSSSPYQQAYSLEYSMMPPGGYPQQMLPMQGFDEGPEHLSFSMWGESAADCLGGLHQQQAAQQNAALMVQQQHLTLLQQRQQLLQQQQQLMHQQQFIPEAMLRGNLSAAVASEGFNLVQNPVQNLASSSMLLGQSMGVATQTSGLLPGGQMPALQSSGMVGGPNSFTGFAPTDYLVQQQQQNASLVSQALAVQQNFFG